jgi:hypothetical protein
MKRYLLFAGDNFYPEGGWNDYCGSFDTIDEAIDYLNGNVVDWWHIVDIKYGVIVKSKSSGKYDSK